MKAKTPLDKLEVEFTEILTDWEFEHEHSTDPSDVKEVVKIMMSCVGVFLGRLSNPRKH